MFGKRTQQIVLVCSLGWISWLGMMLVHEAGHVAGAIFTGGHVERVIWHPLVLSRTDVQSSRSAMIVVWGGPVFGSVVPLIFELIAIKMRWRLGYMAAFFAGFCLAMIRSLTAA